ncbi:MAG: YbaB/EbfC family nucleoid-associated protein [Sphaerochaetaceae bacterium]|nr:YbaB/EbfC family nucleoid-associated protein [Sphaerochaetaceae bacterium]
MINPLEMMKNLENIKAQAEELKKKTASIKATGYAMGNMIEVVATGEFKIESVKIDPSLLEQDPSMLQVLLASAVNNALDNVKSRLSQEVGQMGQGLNLGI